MRFVPLFGLLLAASGCSLALDLSKKQCNSKADCDKLSLDTETYVCQNSLCQHIGCEGKDDQFCRKRPEGGTFATSICEKDPQAGNVEACLPAECLKSTDCDLGGEDNGICNTERGRCVKRSDATCTSGEDAECAKYEGRPICSNKLCEETQCTTNQQCRSVSTTAVCRAGKCVDEAWGCVGDLDDREEISQPGDFAMVIYNVLDNAIPSDLDVKICGGLQDLPCNTPPAGATWVVDKKKNTLIIKNLAQSSQVHLQLFAGGIFNTEFYSQRSVRGARTDELSTIGLIPTSLIGVLQSATDAMVDAENNGTFVGFIHDCEDNPGAGVALISSQRQADTRVFYITEGNAPLTDANTTDPYGAFGAVNLVANTPTTMIAQVGTTEVASFSLTPKAGWMSYVQLYPRVYSQ